MDNRPQSRKKTVSSEGTGVQKRGEGLGTGPVGSSNGYQGRKTSGSSGSGGSGSGVTRGATLSMPVVIILIVVFLLSRCNNGTQTVDPGTTPNVPAETETTAKPVDTNVTEGTRDKYTQLKGDGTDTVTILVYMCGTDLESKYGMASADLAEMVSAELSGKVNLIVYTGGCSGWKTSGISSSVNQIYQVTASGLKRLVDNDGSRSMTDPATLTSFIDYGVKNFPANRKMLIFWDHGGGSVSGYGYDEKFKGSAMNLAGINTALKNAGVQFDIIGFDACLMGTAETALMLNPYADYMIASEETEPGIGWYYTNWLTKLSANTSLSSLTVGQNIVDDFIKTCGTRCKGQNATLSLIDLAEFSGTVPAALRSFAQSVSGLIADKEYQTVSDARYNCREFATSTKIDQVDLVHLALNMGNSEGKALAKVLQSAVKYNRTSTNMTNCYGVSIYFPYKRTSYVDSACKAYDAIGMDGSYATCIRQFASLETSGQIAAGGSTSSSSLFDMLGGFATSSSSSGNADIISSLLGSFLSSGGSSSLIEGLTSGNIDFFSDRALSQEDTAQYLSVNYFDADALEWERLSDGSARMTLSEAQWSLVHELDLNMFYNDGTGYIDLGLDNIFDFDKQGRLIASTDRTWVSINGQPVAYYHLTTEEDGTVTGRVPAFLNGTRVNLLLVFDAVNGEDYVAGAITDYVDGETETVSKELVEIKEGDVLEFIADYYSYSGEYEDTYYLGEPLTVGSRLTIANTPVGKGEVRLMYRFTDIYNQEYWAPVLVY